MTALVMLTLFSLTSILGFFAVAEPARAQLEVGVLADVPRTVDTVLSKVLQGLKIGVLNVASGAVSYALQKIAYDSAVWIASGGKGQGALVFSKGFGSYLSDVGNDALGHGIDKLSRTFGTNFCKIGISSATCSCVRCILVDNETSSGISKGIQPQSIPCV